MLILNGAKPPTIPYPYLPIQGTIGCTPIHKPFTYPRNIGLFWGDFSHRGPTLVSGYIPAYPLTHAQWTQTSCEQKLQVRPIAPSQPIDFSTNGWSHIAARCFQMRFLVGGFLLPPYKWSQKVIYIYILYNRYIYTFYKYIIYIYIYMYI